MWKSMKDKEATYKVLLTALVKSNNSGAADVLVECLNSKCVLGEEHPT